MADPSKTGSGGSHNGPVGGGALVGDSVSLLLGIVAVYGAYVLVGLRWKKEKDLPHSPE